jgi:hypothetical protein
MIEASTTHRWSILDIVNAHSLDFYRARALTLLLCPNIERLETLEIRDAISYLEYMLESPHALMNADVLADMAADDDDAQDMTGAAIAEAYGITTTHLIDAIAAMLSDPSEISSISVVRRRVSDALKHLRAHLAEQEGDA